MDRRRSTTTNRATALAAAALALAAAGSLPHGAESFSPTKIASVARRRLPPPSPASSSAIRGRCALAKLCMVTGEAETDSDTATKTEEAKLDELLSQADLKAAERYLKSHPGADIDRDRLLGIFDAIKTRTSDAEENNINTRLPMEEMAYPPVSPARTEMTDMYRTLAGLGHLRMFGAAGREGRPYPAMGSKDLTPNLLEQITDMSMVALTPQPTNTLLYGGIGLCVLEIATSLATGIDFNFLVFATLFTAFLDRLIVNGAVFETAVRMVMPKYGRKILKHEAGHFLCAYLLGCPVEGCVLSPWGALQDSRFGGRATSVSAGTSFFDPELSDEINGRGSLSRSSIDRYSVIVMGGIAAEAIEFGMADGGAGDEMALVQFLSGINPRGGGAKAWTADRIKNQARWGATQAVLLLREYKDCYEALVDALERGGDLGECIWAIENAARAKDVKPLEAPVGYILEKGLYGEWTTEPPLVGGEAAPVTASPSQASATEQSIAPPPDLESSRETLSQYRQMVEEKLKKIDEQLNDMK